MPIKMYSANSFFDISAGPVPHPRRLLSGRIGKTYTGKDLTSFEECDQPKYQCCGAIKLLISMGGSRFRVCFGIVHSIAVPILPDTSVIDKFVKGSLPPEQKRVSFNSILAPLLARKDLPEEKKER